MSNTTCHTSISLDGFDATYAQARETAGADGADIAGGASTVRQALAAGVVDELTLDIAPVLLGSGERIFDGVESLGMIDVPGPSGGAPVRLTFKEKTFKVRGAPERGDVVPVIVNAKRTKAMFDLSDPRIDGDGWIEAQAKRRKQRDDERFEALRAGREPAPEAEDD